MLDHGVELQFMAGPCFVRGEGPRDRIESEVIVLVHSAARCRRDIERQNELSALTGIVQKRRRTHVWGRLLRGFSRRREPDDGGAVRQSDQILRNDDLFDFMQAIFEEGQNRLAGDLLLLQFRDYCAIVAGRIAVGFGDLRRQWRHFVLILRKGSVRHLGNLRRRNIDAVAFECENIFLRRQAKIGARLGQNRGLDPGVVLRQLHLQFCIGGFPAGQVVLFK